MQGHLHSTDCELVVGLVAPVGVNLDDVRTRLESLFRQFRYSVNFIHVSKLANAYMYDQALPSEDLESLSELKRLDYGMCNGRKLRERSRRGDFYALLAINAINEKRYTDNSQPMPLRRQAHVIRSLKHPDEVETLRGVYGDGFFLLGVSSSIKSRTDYLVNMLGVPEQDVERLIERDDKEAGDFGQRTRDVFELADAFVTVDDEREGRRLDEQLVRVLDLLFSRPVVSPMLDEYAMFLAYAASLRSADLSRQVGAVIVNEHGDIVATGANDVPRYGGGLYWPGSDDQRDFISGEDFNEREKREIVLRIMRKFRGSGAIDDHALIAEGMDLLRDTGVLNITEYGRAVHAEMEAILSAARNGISVRNATLYSTTYPCHNCAKHIVASGITVVKYIEPYPKSYATQLHRDSIEASGEHNEQKVRFEPFVGIGPRKFVDLFSMGLGGGRKIIRKVEGRLFDWSREDAELRVPMTPFSYLDAEIMMVRLLAKTPNGDRHGHAK